MPVSYNKNKFGTKEDKIGKMADNEWFNCVDKHCSPSEMKTIGRNK